MIEREMVTHMNIQREKEKERNREREREINADGEKKD